MIFSASTGIISSEIRLLIAKLWLNHWHVTFIKKNHVANLPEKDSNINLSSLKIFLYSSPMTMPRDVE